MKTNPKVTVLFAGILLFSGFAALYSGIETCDFCPFHETVREIFSLIPVNGIAFVFAPVLFGLFGHLSLTQLAVACILYGLTTSILAGILYARYQKILFQPMKIYFGIGMGFLLIVMSPMLLFQIDTDIGMFLQLFISIAIPIAFYSYFLSGILLFASTEIFQQPWNHVSLKTKVVLFLAVTFVEYLLFRLVTWGLFAAVD